MVQICNCIGKFRREATGDKAGFTVLHFVYEDANTEGLATLKFTVSDRFNPFAKEVVVDQAATYRVVYHRTQDYKEYLDDVTKC